MMDEDQTYSTYNDDLPKPNLNVQCKLGDLVKTIQIAHGSKNGMTCLYWDLYNTIQKHLEK